MDPQEFNICLSSFNSTGFGIGAQNFVTTLSSFSNILCLQEHFLLDGKLKNHSNTDQLKKVIGHKYDMYVVPAHKDNSQVSKGRGKGGLATCWDKGLNKYVSKVPTSNFRLQATKFDLPSGSFLILNSYFPCDPRTSNFNEDELLTLLGDIRALIEAQECSYNLVVGDFNSHFERQTNFTSIIQTFFDEVDYKILWQNPDNSPDHLIHDIDFTFANSVGDSTFLSKIDHFATNVPLFNSIDR